MPPGVLLDPLRALVRTLRVPHGGRWPRDDVSGTLELPRGVGSFDPRFSPKQTQQSFFAFTLAPGTVFFREGLHRLVSIPSH
jgi:hypothetical protein